MCAARERRAQAREWRQSLWELRRAEVKQSILERKRQHIAARTIQAHWRGYTVREGELRAKAATVFQRQIRAILLRRRSASCIQAHCRGVLCRRSVLPWMEQQTGKRSAAGTRIQARWRGRSVRVYARRRFYAILTISKCACSSPPSHPRPRYATLQSTLTCQSSVGAQSS